MGALGARGGGQEVPADHEAERVVYPFSCQSNEPAADGVCSTHFRDAVVDHGQHHGLNRVGQEQAPGATIVETSADTDEEGRSDRASDSDELDLAIVQVSLEIVGVVCHPLLNLLGVTWRRGLFFIFTEEIHLELVFPSFGASCDILGSLVGFIPRKKEDRLRGSWKKDSPPLFVCRFPRVSERVRKPG